MNSMITTTTWVRRGIAAQFPTKYEIDEDEINRISELAKLQLEDAKGDLKAAEETAAQEEEDADEDDDDVMEEEAEVKTSKPTGKKSSSVLAFIFFRNYIEDLSPLTTF